MVKKLGLGKGQKENCSEVRNEEKNENRRIFDHEVFRVSKGPILLCRFEHSSFSSGPEMWLSNFFYQLTG